MVPRPARRTPSSSSRSATALALVIAFAAPVALGLGGCGGASKAPESAASFTDERDPGSVEEAEARIARARTALGLPSTTLDDPRAGSGPSSPAAPPADSPRPAEPAAAPDGAADARPRAQATAEGAASEKDKGDDGEASRCATACRARASMARAAVTLCRLAGEGDARCARAQRSVHEADAAVAACRCPS